MQNTALQAVQEDEPLGQLEQLASPVLGKIKPALVALKLCLDRKKAFGSRTVVLTIPANNVECHMAFFKDAGSLCLAIKGHCTRMDSSSFSEDLVQPKWLHALAPGAEIHEPWLTDFDALRDHGRTLAECIRTATDGMTPRKIICVGYCAGGAVATVAALWVALQCPTADVRCITFGSPKVGNAAFAEVFRWLVGISYRVVYRRDPVPTRNPSRHRPNMLSSLTHVHGSVYIKDGEMAAAEQPTSEKARGELADHDFARYSEAVHAVCMKHFERDRVLGGSLYSTFAACYLKLAGEDEPQAPTVSRRRLRVPPPAEAPPPSTAAFSPPRLHINHPDVKGNEMYAAVKEEFEQAEADRVHRQQELEAARTRLEQQSPARARLADPSQAPDAADMFGSQIQRDRVALPGQDPAAAERQQQASAGLFDGVRPAKPMAGAAQMPAIPQRQDRSAASEDLAGTTRAGGAGTQATAQQDGDDARALSLLKAALSGTPDEGQLARDEAVRRLGAQQQADAAAAAQATAGPDPPSEEQQMVAASEDQPPPQSGQRHAQCAAKFGLPEDFQLPKGHEKEAIMLHVALLGNGDQASAIRRCMSSSQQQKGGAAAGPGSSGGIAGAQPVAGQAADADGAGIPAEPTLGSNSRPQRWGPDITALETPNEPWKQHYFLETEQQRPTLEETRARGSGALNCSAARRVTQGVVDEATGGQNAGIGPSDGEGGGSVWLKRAFSMMDHEDVNVDLGELDTLAKILVVGKISQAVVIAAAAYRDEETFRQRTGITNSRLVMDELHLDTQVHVGWLEGGTAVFAFRGTDSAADGLQDVKIMRRNIDYLQELFPGVRAHAGFMQQFAALTQPDKPDHNLAEVLKQLSGGRVPSRVLCCGHSLGGALATLGAAWAALEYPQADVRCITFGSPRVGNKAFKKAFHTLVGTSYRLVHGGDPVPGLPPALNYHHVDGSIHILKDQGLLLRHRPWHFKWRWNLADHLVARYNAGVWFAHPGGHESMPLPHPKRKSMERTLSRGSQRGSSQNGQAHGRKGSVDGKPVPADEVGPDKAPRVGNEWGLWSLLACVPLSNLSMRQQVEVESSSGSDEDMDPKLRRQSAGSPHSTSSSPEFTRQSDGPAGQLPSQAVPVQPRTVEASA